MKEALLRLYNCSWRLFIAALVALLLVVAGARIAVTCLPFFQDSITRYFNKNLDALLQIDQLSTDWQGGMPVLTVRGLQLQGADAEKPGLTINRLDLQLNVSDSLLHRTLVFRYLKANGVALKLSQAFDGSWTFSGIESLGAKQQQQRTGKPKLLDWVKYQDMLDISDSSLTVIRANGEKAKLRMPYFSLTNHKETKKLAARFDVGSGQLQLSGRGLEYGDKGWHGYISIKNIDLTKACPLLAGCKRRLNSSTITGDMSWYYDNGQWQLEGVVGLPDVKYTSYSGNQHIAESRSKLFGKGVAGGSWAIWLNDLLLAVDGKSLLSGNWYIAGDSSPESSVTIANQHIELASLKSVLLQAELLPALPVELLETLNPRGTLNDFALRVYPQREPFDIDLSAQLSNVAVDAWQGAPLADHVSGNLRMSLLKGYLDLDSEQFSLGFPKLFPETWHYDSAQARLYWDVVNDTYTLKSDRIRLKGQEGVLTGQLKLNVPLDGQPLAMALTVGLKDGQIKYAKKYIPAKLDALSGELASWLDAALRNGAINEGGFLYNGVLENTEVKGDVNWGLYFDVSDAFFNYHQDWPAINALSGKVYVNNNRVEVLGKRADVLGAHLLNAVARVPLTGESTVSVRGRVIARKNVLHRFLTETPIDSFMGGEAKKWKLTGDLSSLLQLTIPLSHPEKTDASVKGVLKDYNISLPEYDVALSQINGDIGFSTKDGLTSKALYGTLFGQPVAASIATKISGNEPEKIQVQWQGKADVQSLHEWLSIDALSLAKGKTDYSASLSIELDKKKTTVVANSNLKGVAVDLPAPLHKTAGSSQSLAMEYIAKAGGNDLNLTLEGLGKAALSFNVDSSVKGASVVMGSEVTTTTPLPAVVSEKIQVQGSLPELDLTPWYKRFQTQPANAKERLVSDWLKVENILIGKLRYNDYVLDNIQLGINPEGHSLKLTVASEPIAGSLWIPERESTPYRLELDHLKFPESKGANKQSADSSVKLTLSPFSVPPADISINSLVIGKQTIKNLSLKLRQMPDGIRAESLQATLSGMAVRGRGEWVERDQKQHTYFDGVLEGKTLERLQENFEFSSFIKAEDSRLTAKYNWQGSPLDISVNRVTGTLALRMRNGRLKKMEGGAGALKMFGLLNTESLRRRLKLDFSDLYASGISFDKLDGTLRFNKGIVTFDVPIDIKGPSSHFKLDGLFDGNKETMDASVVVTLPVASNLPIFSVLLGVTPQIAGIIYLADKLVGKQVDQLASIRYQIKGTFDNPEVSLDSFFSNKTKKPE